MRGATGTQDGFTILEVVVAIGVISLVATGTAQLASLAVDGNLAARDRTFAAILAAQKLEQLRSLRWTYRDDDGALVRLSDVQTNLAVDPASSTGTGLRPTSVGALESSTPGFVDYLDASGSWVGTGSSPIPGTMFVRRWSITRLPDDPDDTLVLQVRVTALRREYRLEGRSPPGSLPDEAWLITVLTRKAS
jgi:prepilin-type N-terminal cleavage/methylation domain-containing protein